ncbi:MAG: hypothetical protein CM1200mP37_0440 [Chloroflexota bacterium]|nr:MAG: hypothetical protein CM1200mP37_0440 [Chloroflexota bacterium]
MKKQLKHLKKTTTEELEQGKLSLDRAMELYENGMELATYCFELLNKAEKKNSRN